MKLKELLLNGFSFKEILKSFSIEQSEFEIQDEELILSRINPLDKEIFKERVLLQCTNPNGKITLFGTLHYNQQEELAVFELDTVEQHTAQVA